MPDPDCERPSYMKKRARQLLFEAARLADASTLGEGQRAEIKRMRSEAKRLQQQRMEKLTDKERAVTHPATRHTAAAWGARPGEPLPRFARALRRSLLDMGVERDLADRLVDPGEEEDEGKGRGKGGGKGRKGKGKR